MDRAMRLDVRISGNRPREANAEVIVSVLNKFKDAEAQ